MSLSRNIKMLRTSKGIQPKDLANKAKIGVSTLYAIEQDRANPTIKIIKKIAQALDVETSDLLSDMEISFNSGKINE